jgi:hypothetical protein
MLTNKQNTHVLTYCTAGHWLLEVFDQLYWTADQLHLRQLASIIYLQTNTPVFTYCNAGHWLLQL